MNRPFIITVSGSHGGAGKTALIEMLLPYIPNAVAVKVQYHDGHASSLMEETDASADPSKDTARYLTAGARKAFLITGGDGSLSQLVEKAISSDDFDAVLIESNRMAREMESDLSFYVRAIGEEKLGADECRRRADVVVEGFKPKEAPDG